MSWKTVRFTHLVRPGEIRLGAGDGGFGRQGGQFGQLDEFLLELCWNGGGFYLKLDEVVAQDGEDMVVPFQQAHDISPVADEGTPGI